MSVYVFLEEFVLDSPAARPHGNFAFSKDPVSQNERICMSTHPHCCLIANDTIDRRRPEFWVVP